MEDPYTGQRDSQNTGHKAHLGLITNQYPAATLETWHRTLCHRTLDSSGVNSIASRLTSAKKAFSPDGQSPLPDQERAVFGSGPPGSPVPSWTFICCTWCTRTPPFPSTASDTLVAAPPPPRGFSLYPPPYPFVYWPPAYYSLRLRASGDHLVYPHTSGDLDLSASIRICPLPS